jgi:hypothetical protein
MSPLVGIRGSRLGRVRRRERRLKGLDLKGLDTRWVSMESESAKE